MNILLLSLLWIDRSLIATQFNQIQAWTHVTNVKNAFKMLAPSSRTFQFPRWCTCWSGYELKNLCTWMNLPFLAQGNVWKIIRKCCTWQPSTQSSWQWRHNKNIKRYKIKQNKKTNTNKTLPKAQRTRGLSSSCQSNFLRSYQKFKHKSWSHFIFRISTKHQLKISTKHQHLHKT